MITTYEVTLKVSMIHEDGTLVDADSVKKSINQTINFLSEVNGYNIITESVEILPSNVFVSISNLKVNGINQPLLEFGTNDVQWIHISNV